MTKLKSMRGFFARISPAAGSSDIKALVPSVATILGTAFFAASTLSSSPVQAACSDSQRLLAASKEDCARDSSYCEDVPLYQEDVNRDCGVSLQATRNRTAAIQHRQSIERSQKLAATSKSKTTLTLKSGSKANNNGATAGTSTTSSGLTPKPFPVPDPSENAEKNLPASCAYFTKPPVDASYTHVYYHQPGALVCYNGNVYECAENREWKFKMTCDHYWGDVRDIDVNKLENSSINTNIYSSEGSNSPPDGDAGEGSGN
ncbi:hypothetical protein QA648_36570 (plasmid) [Rhizobium sp. CB3171]|uniref:hypothetical protein n=1 Tax=Rhizobium sp. CB3171 TaxID=3039157 RepID=UPI0024B27788|nr:hypothetical protein [Rhizobium sp. CB3171]WFU07446.1 hypothetical protein QA648_36570 [Rhizobium sp. CB3171]